MLRWLGLWLCLLAAGCCQCCRCLLNVAVTVAIGREERSKQRWATLARRGEALANKGEWGPQVPAATRCCQPRRLPAEWNLCSNAPCRYPAPSAARGSASRECQSVRATAAGWLTPAPPGVATAQLRPAVSWRARQADMNRGMVWRVSVGIFVIGYFAEKLDQMLRRSREEQLETKYERAEIYTRPSQRTLEDEF